MITGFREKILKLVAPAGCQLMYQLRNVFKDGLKFPNFFITDLN